MAETGGAQAELLKKYPSMQKWIDDPEGYDEVGQGREQALLQHVRSRFDGINATPAKVLAAMDEFARNVDFLISIGPHKGGIMAELIAEEKPKILVELGGYVGYSAIAFGEAMRKAAAPGEEVRVVSLEFDQEYARIAEELVEIAGLGGVVTIVVGAAEESLQSLKRDGKLDRVDMLFLDHVEALYEQDLKVCESLGLLRAGACVVADNVVRPGAPEYRQYVRGHAGLKSWGVRGLIVPGDFEDELEVSKVL